MEADLVNLNSRAITDKCKSSKIFYIYLDDKPEENPVIDDEVFESEAIPPDLNTRRYYFCVASFR